MTDNFLSLSNKIANNFLHNIVFIDDKAYLPVDATDTQHDFDAQAITRVFAHDKKICSVFQPETEEDIGLFSEIAKKADVTVLDWQMVIQSAIPSTGDLAVDDEDDAEDDDIRGLYSRAIIRDLLCSASSQNSLKLILIYTGETDLNSIATQILDYLNAEQITGFQISNDNCCVESKSCKILVRAKANGGAERGKHLPALREKEVSYENLPKFINDEFSKMTNGLLSNLTLQALTVIRENFFQILNVFSKNLDAAFLTHKSLLPNTNAANELLIELLGDTLTSILRAKNLSGSITPKIIEDWIDHHIVDENRFCYDVNGQATDVTFIRNKQLLMSMLESSGDVKKKIADALIVNLVSKKSAEKNYKQYAFGLFHKSGEDETCNKNFAALCQHKNLIKYDNYLPTLSLGTVVKSSANGGAYYVCIQQRCDSVRVTVQQPRRFLFLSLSIVDGPGKFDFIAPDGNKLKLDKSTYDIRTVKFCGSIAGVVEAKVNVDGTYFFPFYHPDETNEVFEFVFELKDLYAQKIVADYSSTLSRVGLDEPEWVRLSRSGND